MDINKHVDKVVHHGNQIMEYIKNNRMVSFLLITVMILVIVVIRMKIKLDNISLKEHLTNCTDIDMTVDADVTSAGTVTGADVVATQNMTSG